MPTLEPELKAKLQKVSVQAYRALRVHDYGRIDLRLTDTGEIYVIEVNANCYLEQDSEFARAAGELGIDYPALLEPHRGARARALEAPQPRAEAPQEGARRARLTVAALAVVTRSVNRRCRPAAARAPIRPSRKERLRVRLPGRSARAALAAAPAGARGALRSARGRFGKVRAAMHEIHGERRHERGHADDRLRLGRTRIDLPQRSARFARSRTRLRVFSGKWPVQRNTSAMSSRSRRRISSLARTRHRAGDALLALDQVVEDRAQVAVQAGARRARCSVGRLL